MTNLPCGCVVTKRGGHVHTKFCPTCKDRLFGKLPRAPQETKAEYAERLEELRKELA
jgi:hypothetical protein